MAIDERQRRVTTYTTRTASYGASSSRSAWGYWVPLAITVTAATVALGAWIWSERDDDNIETSESETDHYYASAGSGPPPGARDDRRNQRPGGLMEDGVGAGLAAAGGGLAGAAIGAAAGAAAGVGTMSGAIRSDQNQPQTHLTGSQAFPPGGMPPEPHGLGPPAAGGFIAGTASMNQADLQAGLPGATSGTPLGQSSATAREVSVTATAQETAQQDQGFMARMSNAVGFGSNADQNQGGNWASNAMMAATAAAGAAVGTAISAVRGSNVEEQYNEQAQWREEIDNPDRGTPKQGIARTGTAEEFYSGAVELPKRIAVQNQKRTTVVIVVSAVEHGRGTAEIDAHTSILAHLPHHINATTTRVVVLIYTPDLRTHPLSSVAKRAASARSNSQPDTNDRQRSSSRQSTTSSYANIATPRVNTPTQTPGDFPQDFSEDQGILAHVEPLPVQSQQSLPRDNGEEIEPVRNPLDYASPLYKSLHNQSIALVERETHILPFTGQQGHKHILRSIGPEIVYIQESLCGQHGEIVSELKGWVRQVVVVIGDEHGAGGLVDSDDEDAGRGKGGEWWKREEVTGVGRGVAVVESVHVGEDWQRRVGGTD